jgi:NADH dehydrogenase [ubiquinone] 1 alpha subcomplex assembly factor 7
MSSPLEAEIRRRIETDGPISVAEYMAMCVTGYYATRDPLGKAGDFTTSPEISQMFGELIGLWAAAVWRMLGEPNAINVVELGPGRGTMMADALRAAKALPAFKQAISVHLVETSRTLRERQREVLKDSTAPIAWHDSLDAVPQTPAIYLANEFFDAMPVHQAIRQPDGWRERTVEIGSDGLRFATSSRACDDKIPDALRDAPVGSIIEWRSGETERALAARVARHGAALVIDYGHMHSAIGDTLQAVRAHAYHPPLADPGSADLTAHVDFEAIAAIAASAGARAHGPIEQGTFLRRLGIDQRAAMLKGKADAAQTRDIDAAVDRLTATTPAGMGRMFKVLGIADARLGPLPAFDG